MDGSNGRISCKSLSVILLRLWFHHFEKCFWKALRNRKNNRQFSLSRCTPDRYLTIEVEVTKSSWNSFRTVQFFIITNDLNLNIEGFRLLNISKFLVSETAEITGRPAGRNQIRWKSKVRVNYKLNWVLQPLHIWI